MISISGFSHALSTQQEELRTNYGTGIMGSGTGMLQCWNAPVPECIGAGMLRYRNVPVPECSGTGMLRYRDAPVPERDAGMPIPATSASMLMPSCPPMHLRKERIRIGA